MSNNEHISNDLPSCVTDYINLVIKKMRYSRKARKVVRQELTDHFTDALADCKNQQEQHETAENLIAEFGDAKVLAKLIRRGKKRCRPLWKKMLSYTVRAFLIFMVLRVGALGIGTPGTNVDYTDWITKQSSQDRPESQNAKPYYDKAGELMGSYQWPKILNDSYNKWPGEMSQAERKEVVEFIKANEKALDMLKQGTMKPYYWLDYAAVQKTPDPHMHREATFEQKLFPDFFAKINQGLMPILTKHKRLAKTMGLRAHMKAYQGDLEGAFDDCLTLQKFAGHLQGKGLLIEQIVGIGIEGLGHGRIFDILSKVKVKPDLLKTVQVDFERAFTNQDIILSLEAEKSGFYDYVQRTFTDDGKGSGRMLIKGVPLSIGTWQSALHSFFLFDFPDKREVIETIDEFYDITENSFETTPFESQNKQEEILKEREHLLSDNILLTPLAPALDTTNTISWRLRATRTATITALALLRYEKEHGEYPADLADLVARGYLKELPRDPYSEGPLQYKREKKDFLLYCLGEDYDDDGGLQSNWGRYEAGGDRVFWPANKEVLESP